MKMTTEEAYEIFSQKRPGDSFILVDLLARCVFDNFEEDASEFGERTRKRNKIRNDIPQLYTLMYEVKNQEDFDALVARIKIELVE